MTRGEIRTLVRTWVNDKTASSTFYSDDDLNLFINTAMNHINAITTNTREDYFTSVSTFSTTISAGVYALPTDFRIMRRLEQYSSSDASEIAKLNTNDFPNMERGAGWPFSATGEPQRYMIVGNKLRLFPTPDAAYTLRIWYDRRQDKLITDTDVPTIMEDFHDLIALRACILALPVNSEGSEEYGAIYKERKRDYIDTLERFSGDDPQIVVGYLEGYLNE